MLLSYHCIPIINEGFKSLIRIDIFCDDFENTMKNTMIFRGRISNETSPMPQFEPKNGWGSQDSSLPQAYPP